MTLTIGRASGLRLARQSPRASGVIDLSGTIMGTTLQELKARRQQLLGLNGNPDELVVPVIWSSDATYDGFYRVRDMTVEPIATSSTPRARFSCTVEPVVSYANPMFEVTTQSVVRTNGHGITAPTTIIAYGPAVDIQNEDLVDLYPGLSTASGGRTNTLSDGYAQKLYTKAAPQTLTAYRYLARAAMFYKGAATIEVQYSGSSTWYPVVGTQIYDTSATATNGAPISAWRISNGIVRLTSVTAYNGGGTFEVWDNGAGAWEALPTIWMHNGTSNYGGPGNLGVRSQVRSPVILRNGPEHVTLRVQTGRMVETWSLQRGALFAACHVYDPRNTTDQYGIGLSSSSGVAGTSITGGVRVTSNDANGNRAVFATDVANTVNTANTYLYATTAGTINVNVMVGVELGGSGAGSGSQAADLVNQFIGSVQWRQRVVR